MDECMYRHMDAWMYECDWLAGYLDVSLDEFFIHYIIDSSLYFDFCSVDCLVDNRLID